MKTEKNKVAGETKRSAGVTFAVADVTPATELLPMLPYADALASALGHGDAALESYSRNTKPLVNPRPHPVGEAVHAFIYAANLAYDQHHPLTLSPDMIWLLIAQGFAQHVNVKSDGLRDRFVSHRGKVRITVIRDEFVRGFAGNDWEGVFGEFSQQIREHVGAQNHALVVRRFSTTGPVEQAAFAVTLMDAVQNYFDYRLLSRCGIPEIALEGTVEDWQEVRAGAGVLAQSGCGVEWWTDALLPVLDEFVAARRGAVDPAFWENFYKREHGSGGPYISGHVVNLFPYLVEALPNAASLAKGYRDGGSLPYRNPHLGWYEPTTKLHGHVGMTTRQLPSALSVAPFIWKYWGKEYPMEFVAGFVGVAQDAATLALRPEIGWAVRERGAQV